MLDEQPERKCFYCSLKDEPEALIKRFELAPYLEDERLIIYDYDSLIDKIPTNISRENILGGICKTFKDLRIIHGEKLSLFALDPINTLWSLIPIEHLRRVLYHFYSEIADSKSLNWIISEKIDERSNSEVLLPCYFLSDAIIDLGISETQNDVLRFIEVKKMRGVSHSLKRFQISYKKNILKILGSTYEL